jgi:superfamily II DNA or RNA helicase
MITYEGLKSAKRDSEKTDSIYNSRCKKQGFRKLTDYQMILRNVFAPWNQRRNMLLYHETGSGKTCTALAMADLYRTIGTSVNKIIIVTSERLAKNFMKEFGYLKKESRDDGVDHPHQLYEKYGTRCLGTTLIDHYTLSQMQTYFEKTTAFKELGKDIHNELRKTYQKYHKESFYYTIDNFFKIYDEENIQKLKNSIVIMDEAHTVFNTDNSNSSTETTERTTPTERTKKKRKTATERTTAERKTAFLENIFKHRETLNVRFLLLTATPVPNFVQDIKPIVQLFVYNNPASTNNDKIDVDSLFYHSNPLSEDEKRIEKYLKGCVSYVKSENPFEYPVRIFPKKDAVVCDYLWNTVTEDEHETQTSPSQRTYIKKQYSLNKNPLYKLYPVFYNCNNPVELIQSKNSDLSQKLFEFPDSSTDYSLTNIKEKIPKLFHLVLELMYCKCPYCLLKDREDILTKKYSSKSLYEIYREICVKGDYTETLYTPNKEDKPEDKLKKKTKKCTTCKNYYHNLYDNRTVLVYCRWIRKGTCRIFECLKQNGFANVVNLSSSSKSEETINTDLSQRKIIIFSDKFSHGVDYKNIGAIHITTPWWHVGQLEQIIGRGLRFCSFDTTIPQEKRNVLIYMYCVYYCHNNENYETVDHYMYRRSFEKYEETSKIENLLKKIAVDCNLNKDRNIFDTVTFTKMIDFTGEVHNQYRVQSDQLECHLLPNDLKNDIFFGKESIKPLLSYYKLKIIDQLKKLLAKGNVTYPIVYPMETIKEVLRKEEEGDDQLSVDLALDDIKSYGEKELYRIAPSLYQTIGIFVDELNKNIIIYKKKENTSVFVSHDATLKNPKILKRTQGNAPSSGEVGNGRRSHKKR